MKEDTRIVTAGRDPAANFGIVNPPVYHCSTVLFPTLAALEAQEGGGIERRVSYGRAGTPTTFALEDAMTALEGGYATALFPSGLAAATTALLAFLQTGDHLLMTDAIYGPTRRFCDKVLTRLGVETTYFDPLIGRGVAALLRPTTRVVYLESPGSQTFEVQDVPAIAGAAHAAGARVLLDNTWATPCFFKAFTHGVDVSIQAATKYIVGHADVMLGTATATEAAWPALRQMARDIGTAVAPDDCYLAQRGLRTLSVRLQRHQESALRLARWLQLRLEVARVLYPALPEDPGHAIWRRDFSGASGLFGVVLRPCAKAALAAMLDGMTLFGMGYSWGGYESLILPTHPERMRIAVPWREAGPLLRVHVGLEDIEDLIADLEAGFARLNSHAGAAGALR
ncbi:MAG: cystathionine beta-lyase [Alphaproteobacteria bacterium]|nr:cystathionine beta-lyase [Alphaproteobacteria bacterium]